MKLDVKLKIKAKGATPKVVKGLMEALHTKHHIPRLNPHVTKSPKVKF